MAQSTFVPAKAVAGKSRWPRLSNRRSAACDDDAFVLRAGSAGDLQAVYALNRSCFEEYWSVGSLVSALESGYDLLVCEQDGELAGYLLTLTVVDEIQVMQIAVAPAFRRRGVARLLSEALVAGADGIATVTLEVRLSNTPARRLYAALGFAETGYRKQYYAPNAAGICEDAVLMDLQLPS
ncbi:ribosomal-protein-alanine N-acetyltransferase [Mariprofundus erugo]|uniref:ribosomal protein S18-alanine N-acetyltransferase n=1 Tax=Mariprofundus erugo TaxID=2528639 RepID=UPI0010FF3F06|nr:ribosomal protein S18-alanine N-acetyltransferase [Mariprofundus erugo]TLS77284.1 ribosomal-protein-alanine N-acetyltransferase [Mariprofundus erugo]